MIEIDVLIKMMKLIRYTDSYFCLIFLNCSFVWAFSRYVMDELGSALRHSDEPNFRVSPFLYMPEGKLASAIRCFFPSLNTDSSPSCFPSHGLHLCPYSLAFS